MLIDKYFFVGKNNIPNTDYTDVEAMITELVAEYEPLYYEKMFGLQLNGLYQAGLLVDPVPAIWLSIRDGIQFTSYDGIVRKWEGLAPASKLSPIADYIYYWYLRSNVSQTTGIGEVISEGQNSVNTSSKFKQAEAWNRMVDKNLFLYHFLRSGYEVYPTYSYFTGGWSRYGGRSLLTKINPHNI